MIGPRATPVSSLISARQMEALALMRRAARMNGPADPPHGLLTSEATFWDAEIGTAYVNFTTARSLAKRGLIRYGETDPDYGTDLWLV